MSEENMTITANGAGNATFTYVAPPDVEGMRGLFDVEMLSLTCLRLVPRNNFAKSLLSLMLHGGPARISLSSRGDALNGPRHLQHRDLETRRAAVIEYMELVFEEELPQLSKGGGGLPHYTAMSLKPEEYTAVRAQVEKMRGSVAKRPKHKRGRR